MKESKYNIYLEYKDVFVLYNTLYESILMLSDVIYAKLLEIGIEKCFSTLVFITIEQPKLIRNIRV